MNGTKRNIIGMTTTQEFQNCSSIYLKFGISRSFLK